MKKKIVYIAGYSRSGSTILDILLGNHSKVISTGELVYLFEDWNNPSRNCTCGKPYNECSFWGNYQLPARFTRAQANKILRLVESRDELNNLLEGKIDNKVLEQYKEIQESLFSYIFTTSGKDIIIDSSKSSRDMAGRFYALNKFTDYDVYVIHLVKNGLGIVESYVKKGSNWALEGYGKEKKFLVARSSLGWRLANSLAQKVGNTFFKHKYINIRYEDIAENPDVFIEKIGDFIGIDTKEIIASIQNGRSFSPSHNVGGNRLRKETDIKFITGKSKSKFDLTPYHKLLFNLISGKLNKQFGYKNN